MDVSLKAMEQSPPITTVPENASSPAASRSAASSARRYSSYLDWTSRRHHIARLRYSVRTLLLAALTLGSGMALYNNLEPWVLQRTINFAAPARSQATTAVLSADRRLLAMGYTDASLRVFAVETGLPVLTIPPQTSPIAKLFISSDNKRIAAALIDDSLFVWDAANGDKLLEMHAIQLLGGFSPDSLTLLVRTTRLSRNSNGATPNFSGDLISVLDVPSGECRPLPNTSRCKSASFFPTGREVAVFRGDGTLQVMDAGGRVLLLEMGQSLISFTPDGLKMLTGSLDFQSVNEWDLSESKRRLVLPGHAGGTAAVHYSDGAQSIITTGTDGKVKIWDAASGAPLTTFDIGTKFLPEPGAVFIDPSHVLIPSANGSAEVWHRRRPEYQAGVVVLPELWLMLGFFGALLWSIARDQTDERSIKLRRSSVVPE
jgi:hypothetical protein